MYMEGDSFSLNYFEPQLLLNSTMKFGFSKILGILLSGCRQLYH